MGHLSHKKQDLISIFSDYFFNNNRQNVDSVLERWAKDLQTVYGNDIWRECFKASHPHSPCNGYKEMQYHILYRLLKTPQVLNKIEPSRPASRTKCKLLSVMFLGLSSRKCTLVNRIQEKILSFTQRKVQFHLYIYTHSSC